MSNRQEIKKAISEAWGIAFVICWAAFKICPNVKWWTKPNPEGVNNITFKKSVDEDRTTLTAYINNNKVGSLSMEILFDAYQYEFEDVFDEDTFNEMYPDSEIVKIEHIDVDDNYKNSGIGSQLMKRGIELMKKNGYNQFYLNASPMGFKGLGTMDLVEFYKKFGFKELLNQGHNVLMGVVF